MLRTNSDAPEHTDSVTTPYSPYYSFTTPGPFLLAPSGKRSTYLVPDQAQRARGVIRRVGKLRPGNNEYKHVTGTNREPTTYPNSSRILFIFPRGITHTGEDIAHPLLPNVLRS